MGGGGCVPDSESIGFRTASFACSAEQRRVMPPKKNYERILITLLSPIGDTLFATPAVHALRQNYPRAYIAALVFPTNLGVIESNPDIDGIFVYPTLEKWMGWSYYVNLFRTLQRNRFDLAVDLCTAFWVSRLLCRPSYRVRLRFPPLWWLLPHRGRAMGRTHAVYHYLEALQPLGISVSKPHLIFTLCEEDRDFARRFLAEHGVRSTDLLIAIHPGGEGYYGKKRWKEERFALVGDELVRRHNARVLLLGGDSEKGLAYRVAQKMTYPSINTAGETTLKQTAALVERSQLFIGNDSSPLHIATALSTPVVGIYGPSNVHNFYPFGLIHNQVVRYRSCSPCFHFVGSVPLWMRAFCRTCKCLEDISTDEVLKATEELLAKCITPKLDSVSLPNP